MMTGGTLWLRTPPYLRYGYGMGQNRGMNIQLYQLPIDVNRRGTDRFWHVFDPSPIFHYCWFPSYIPWTLILSEKILTAYWLIFQTQSPFGISWFFFSTFSTWNFGTPKPANLYVKSHGFGVPILRNTCHAWLRDIFGAKITDDIPIVDGLIQAASKTTSWFMIQSII